MKKLLALLAAFALLLSAAAAETRTTTVYVEGEAETVTEEKLESILGFSLWYDTEYFYGYEATMEDGTTTVTVCPNTGALIGYTDLEICTPEVTGLNAADFMTVFAGYHDAEPVTDTEKWKADGKTYTARTYIKNDGQDSLILAVVADGAHELQIVINCPTEAMEGWGARMLHVLDTIEFE